MLMTLTSTLVLVSHRQERVDARYKENNHVLQPLDSADGGNIEGFALQVMAEEEKSLELSLKRLKKHTEVSLLQVSSIGIGIRIYLFDN